MSACITCDIWGCVKSVITMHLKTDFTLYNFVFAVFSPVPIALFLRKKNPLKFKTSYLKKHILKHMDIVCYWPKFQVVFTKGKIPKTKQNKPYRNITPHIIKMF